MKITFNRDWFQRANKTQRQVAMEADLDEAYLSKVVRMQIVPSVEKALIIAESLGCTVDELYTRIGEGSNGASVRSRKGRRKASP